MQASASEADTAVVPVASSAESGHTPPDAVPDDNDTQDAVGDEQLLEAVRAGDESSYGVLYERHRSTALNVARMHTRNLHDAEDLVSEAFAKILAVIRKGGGPQKFMRSYLVTTIGRLAVDHATATGKVQPVGESADLDQVQDFDDVVVKQCDAVAVATAYASLPERWQAVLWHTEVDGMKPKAVAGLLDMSPNAVSALSKRARDGLQTAYLQAQVSHAATDACPQIAGDLGAFVKGNLGSRARRDVQRHLDSCPRCTAEYLQLQDVGVGMRTWLLPVLAALPLWGTESKVLSALMVSGAGATAAPGDSGTTVEASEALGVTAGSVASSSGVVDQAVGSAAAGAGGAVAQPAGSPPGTGIGLKIAVGAVAASAAVALVGVGVNTLVQDDGTNTSTTLGGLPFPANGDVTPEDAGETASPEQGSSGGNATARSKGRSAEPEDGQTRAANEQRSRSPYVTVFDRMETGLDGESDNAPDDAQPVDRPRDTGESAQTRTSATQNPWGSESPRDHERRSGQGRRVPMASPTPERSADSENSPASTPINPRPTPSRTTPAPAPDDSPVPSEPTVPASPRPGNTSTPATPRGGSAPAEDPTSTQGAGGVAPAVPEADSARQPVVEPVSEPAVPEPLSRPVTPTPEPAPQPTPTVEPSVEPSPQPSVVPETEPTPDSGVEPEQNPQPEPMPDSTPDEQPETTQPTPEPTPTSQESVPATEDPAVEDVPDLGQSDDAADAVEERAGSRWGWDDNQGWTPIE
ncbi:MAG: sigma-70 family RNA polymerase sigma factor [Kocuria sp.]|nr:sigma-70 family RNA polymerase sigma factor [Kocuria sp.]